MKNLLRAFTALPLLCASAAFGAPNHQGPWGVFNRGDGSYAGFGPVGTYGASAWAEDWSKMSAEDKKDPLSFLKHISLNDSGSVWLGFSGETRINNYFDQRPVFGAKDAATGKPRPNDSGRFAVRNLWGADLHVGSHVRFFGQLINADAGGWGGYGYDPTWRKNIDVQQAFVELTQNMLGAKTGFIFGRQQFLDAPGYMLGNRDVFNVPVSWNGFRAYSIWKRVRVDAFDFVQTNDMHLGNKGFRNTEDYGTRMYGVTTTIALPDFHFLGEPGYQFLDVFYIGYKMRGGPAQVTVMNLPSADGSTTRNNFGFRWSGQAGPVNFSLGGIYQQGTFHQAATRPAPGVSYADTRRSVQAYAINSTVGYALRHVYGVPVIGMQADVYSGGGARGGVNGSSASVNTYIEPFGVDTNYLDPTNYLTGSNLIDVGPSVSFTPLKWLTVSAKMPFYWRYSTHDSLYSIYGRNEFRNGLGGSNYAGMAPQLAATFQLGQHITWSHHLVRFMTSSDLHHAGASSATYYQSSIDVHF